MNALLYHQTESALAINKFLLFVKSAHLKAKNEIKKKIHFKFLWINRGN